MFIISLLLSISLPALNRVRQQARTLLGQSHQRQIVRAVNLFALDHDDQYPESVATVGEESSWNWGEPTMLMSRMSGRRRYRSMSAYLQAYIADAPTLYCPKAPQSYRYLQAAWEAGEAWDNPDTPMVLDQASGTYCFFGSYAGFLEDRDYLFQGPRDVIGGRGRSGLLVSDYFGHNHLRSRGAYSRCDEFQRASVTEGGQLSSAYWSGRGEGASDAPAIRLHAGYADGHVEAYSSSDTSIMRVIWKPATSELYPQDIGPGTFYLPQNGLR
jgi:hypothetical protein